MHYRNVVTPYAAFPAILSGAARSAGLAWYNFMLALPKMQTQFGSVESIDTRGEVAHLLTWDAKVTTVLAMLGGTGPLLRRYLARDGLLQIFLSRAGSLYEEAFHGGLVGEDEEFSMPESYTFSQKRPSSFTSCSPRIGVHPPFVTRASPDAAVSVTKGATPLMAMTTSPAPRPGTTTLHEEQLQSTASPVASLQPASSTTLRRLAAASDIAKTPDFLI